MLDLATLIVDDTMIDEVYYAKWSQELVVCLRDDATRRPVIVAGRGGDDARVRRFSREGHCRHDEGSDLQRLRRRRRSCVRFHMALLRAVDWNPIGSSDQHEVKTFHL